MHASANAGISVDIDQHTVFMRRLSQEQDKRCINADATHWIFLYEFAYLKRPFCWLVRSRSFGLIMAAHDKIEAMVSTGALPAESIAGDRR